MTSPAGICRVALAGYGRDGQWTDWSEALDRSGRRAVAAIALDCCGVLAFVIIGRHTHHDGGGAAGIWRTAWPFLAGLGIGTVAGRGWRRPLAIVPAGVAAWLGAAVAGMAIRVLAGQGTAAAFIAVTLAFLCLFLLGWRLLARAVAARHPAPGQRRRATPR